MLRLSYIVTRAAVNITIENSPVNLIFKLFVLFVFVSLSVHSPYNSCFIVAHRSLTLVVYQLNNCSKFFDCKLIVICMYAENSTHNLRHTIYRQSCQRRKECGTTP